MPGIGATGISPDHHKGIGRAGTTDEGRKMTSTIGRVKRAFGWIFIAILVTIGGCGPYGLLGDLGIYPTYAEQARRQAAWQEAQRHAAERGVKPGTIGVGDTPAYVRLQWGDPVDIRTSVVGNSTSEWWEYVSGAYSSRHVAL
jgi:hypothetical protein